MIKPTSLPMKPDIQIIIEVESSTGRTMIRSGNNKPVNPLDMISICLSIAQANVQQIINQSKMIIDPNKKIISPETVEETKPEPNGAA